MDVEGGFGDGLDGGDQDGHVFRQTAGHNGVHGDLLHGGRAGVRIDITDQLTRISLGVIQHCPHPVSSRRNHRQPVGPALLQHELKNSLG